MKHTLMRAVAIVVLIAGFSIFGGSQSGLDLDAFLSKNIGISKDQIAAVRNGEPVALNLKSRIPNEIFVFGAIYVNADPGKYLVLPTTLTASANSPDTSR